MRHLTLCALLLLWVTNTCLADNRPPFYQLAGKYEANVKVFHSRVKQVRGIDAIDERAVDRLKRAAVKLKTASRNPRHASRMIQAWQDVQQLHAEVEQRIFAQYTPHRGLISCWESTIRSYVGFDSALFYQVENPRHGNSVRKTKNTNSLRSSLFDSVYQTPYSTIETSLSN